MGSLNNQGGQKSGLIVQRPAQIQKALINITASKYFLESCHKYLIHYLGNSAEVPALCRLLLEKLKINNRGAVRRAEGWRIFQEKIRGTLILVLRVRIKDMVTQSCLECRALLRLALFVLPANTGGL